MDDCNDDRCPGISDRMDRCHLKDEHPGVHDFEGKSHLESQLSTPRPVPASKQRIDELLGLAHALICNGRAWDEAHSPGWNAAKERWITNYHIHLGSTEE
jgi:hypothetical protein